MAKKNTASSAMNAHDPDARFPDSTEPFLHQVKIRNFKSIETCRVELGPLTVLVGRNGSGKSNFLARWVSRSGSR